MLVKFRFQMFNLKALLDLKLLIRTSSVNNFLVWLKMMFETSKHVPQTWKCRCVFKNYCCICAIKNSWVRNALNGLCLCCIVHFVNNANYLSFFSMELEKLLMSDKITPLFQTLKYVSQVFRGTQRLFSVNYLFGEAK